MYIVIITSQCLNNYKLAMTNKNVTKRKHS